MQPFIFSGLSRRWRTVSLLTVAALLAGCASQQNLSNTATSNISWQQHQQQLQALTHYQAQGQLGYISPQQRFSTNLQWDNAPQKSQLQLTTFLGTSVLKLNITPNGAVLVTENGDEYQGHSAAQLVQQLTGIELPVNEMRNWLIGLPTGTKHYQLNQDQQVKWLSKNINGQEWTLQYLAYNNQLSPALPTRMLLEQGNKKIKLMINRWTVPQVKVK